MYNFEHKQSDFEFDRQCINYLHQLEVIFEYLYRNLHPFLTFSTELVKILYPCIAGKLLRMAEIIL